MSTTAAGMLVFGIYFTLVGFGKVAVAKNAEKNAQWLASYGTFFKVAGPAMALGGSVMLFG